MWSIWFNIFFSLPSRLPHVGINGFQASHWMVTKICSIMLRLSSVRKTVDSDIIEDELKPSKRAALSWEIGIRDGKENIYKKAINWVFIKLYDESAHLKLVVYKSMPNETKTVERCKSKTSFPSTFNVDPKVKRFPTCFTAGRQASIDGLW